MGNLKKRLDKIEEKMEIGAESCLLVKFPGKPGFTHGDRSFPSVEAAVDILVRERGRKVKPTVLEVVYVSPNRKTWKLEERGLCFLQSEIRG